MNTVPMQAMDGSSIASAAGGSAYKPAHNCSRLESSFCSVTRNEGVVSAWASRDIMFMAAILIAVAVNIQWRVCTLFNCSGCGEIDDAMQPIVHSNACGWGSGDADAAFKVAFLFFVTTVETGVP